MPCYKISATESNGQPWRAFAEAKNEQLIRDWLAESALAVESIQPLGLWYRYQLRRHRPKLMALLLIAFAFFVPRLFFGKGLLTYISDYFGAGIGSWYGMFSCAVLTIFPCIVLTLVFRIMYVGLIGEHAKDSRRGVQYYNIQRRQQAPIPS